ncbi:hypothetical protein D9C73_000824 [Collichthys lucidus]|uniref:Uncharacterized protein n=1 Tax=Collichthys lucidus TaxID=240159 RepID=A0A4V6AMA4_COLLU|nr:hypothetical protein D9C73_000824 [Collichthys lucidus]
MPVSAHAPNASTSIWFQWDHKVTDLFNVYARELFGLRSDRYDAVKFGPEIYISYLQIRMKAFVFYGKCVSAQPYVRPPPEDSKDSCPSDSAKPGDGESSSESDRSSSDEVTSTSAQAARKKQKRRNKEKATWKTVKQTQSSAKNVPVWQGALPDSDSIRLTIDYFRHFFDTELLALIVNQSNQ